MSAPRIETLVSVVELAARVGVHRHTIHRWVRLKMVPTPLRAGKSFAWPEPIAARIVAAHQATPPTAA